MPLAAQKHIFFYIQDKNKIDILLLIFIKPNIINIMDSINSRLITIMDRLKTTELVQTKNASEGNIERFSKILNLAVPVTELDNSAGEVVRFMYKHNRASFFKYIHINELVHWVLLTDGMPIVSVLKLKGVIVIRWDRHLKEFSVAATNGDYEENTTPSPKPRNRMRRSISSDQKDRPSREKLDMSSSGERYVRKSNYSPNNSRRKEWPAKQVRCNPISPLSSEQYIDILNEARTFQTRASASAPIELTREGETDTTIPATISFSWADEVEAEENSE